MPLLDLRRIGLRHADHNRPPTERLVTPSSVDGAAWDGWIEGGWLGHGADGIDVETRAQLFSLLTYTGERSTISPMRTKKDLASTKLTRPFLTWLKIEAIRKGIPMYELVETLVSRGKTRPWNDAAQD